MENLRDGGARWAAVYGVAQSRTRLKRLSSSSSKGSSMIYLKCYKLSDSPDSSVGKESTCNAGDTSLIPGLGRSAGEGIGYPLQFSWASLVAQLVKNLPTMWETWGQPLNWEYPWRRERLFTPVFWPREFHRLYSSWNSPDQNTGVSRRSLQPRDRTHVSHIAGGFLTS